MWGKNTVVVIIPVLKHNIAKGIIEDFDSTGYVDEIIVIGNKNKTELTTSITQTRARYIKQTQPGLGSAICEAINQTKADTIIITSGDGYYQGKDILKLLSYSDDFEMVFGSRTHLPLIQRGSGMTFIRRIVDDLFGKLVSILYLCSPLTDVGCTLRLTNISAWRKIQRYRKSTDDIFLTEWLLIAAKKKVKFIEIPVHYVAVNKQYKQQSFYYYALRALHILYYIIKIRLS